MATSVTNRIDFSGKKYGMMTITGDAPSHISPRGKKKRMVSVICDCGNKLSVQLTNLKNGNSYSCGCEKYTKFLERNAIRATPQKWTIVGDVAFTEIKGIRVLVDSEDLHLVEKYRWNFDGKGYVTHNKIGDMHRIILGLKPGDGILVDHRHHNRADNRKSMIRRATKSQNSCNTTGRNPKKGKLKGVTFDKSRDKYQAQIQVNKRHIHLGRFSTELEAAKAYDTAAIKLHGEFAFVNFTGDQA